MLPRTKKTIITAGLLVAGAIVLFGGWCLYTGINCSLEAERTLHAYSMVLDLVATHVEKTSGEWPRNWNDLRSITPSSEIAGWKWPRDFDEFQKRIQCDFAVTCAEVAKQTPDNFHAIQQIAPQYNADGYERRLLDACRKYSKLVEPMR